MTEDRAQMVLANIVMRLKELRIQQGFSHGSLGVRAKLTRAGISHIESGKRKPSLLTCLRLADGLDVELSQIIGEAEKLCPRSPGP